MVGWFVVLYESSWASWKYVVMFWFYLSKLVGRQLGGHPYCSATLWQFWSPQQPGTLWIITHIDLLIIALLLFHIHNIWIVLEFPNFDIWHEDFSLLSKSIYIHKNCNFHGCDLDYWQHFFILLSGDEVLILQISS